MSRIVVLALLLPLAIALSACGSSAEADLSNGGGQNGTAPSAPGEEDEHGGTGADQDGPSPADQAGQCVDDIDCEPAALSCCECPSFAVAAGDGFTNSCEDVNQCSEPLNCSPTVAQCDAGACVLACAPVVCELACETGFATDESGCLTCECAPSAGSPDCIMDSDCVAAPADCCGCARGGTDTAVLASEEDEFSDGLNCPANPACPDVDVCNASEEPRCVLGECQLAAASTGPEPVYCGTESTPTCGAGQDCVLNERGEDEASALGVGVCKPAP